MTAGAPLPAALAALANPAWLPALVFPPTLASLPTVVLQTTVGGSRTVVLLALGGLLLAAVLSLAVVYELVDGYRRNGTRPMLALGVGLALLVTGPVFLRIAFGTLVDVSPAARSIATTASELLGLAAILYAIYDP